MYLCVKKKKVERGKGVVRDVFFFCFVTSCLVSLHICTYAHMFKETHIHTCMHASLLYMHRCIHTYIDTYKYIHASHPHEKKKKVCVIHILKSQYILQSQCPSLLPTSRHRHTTESTLNQKQGEKKKTSRAHAAVKANSYACVRV